MADINELKTAPNMKGVQMNKPINLGLDDFIEESDADRERRRQAIEGVNTTGAEVLEDGTKIITPSMIPNIKDPNEPDTRSIEEKDMEKLHDVITRKKAEAEAELNMIMKEAEINERIANEKDIQFNEEGEAVNEDGTAAEELSEDESLEAALDMAIAKDLNGIPGAPMSDPNHVYEEVSDEEFDALMAADDEMNGKFEDANMEHNKQHETEVRNGVTAEEDDAELKEALAETDSAVSGVQVAEPVQVEYPTVEEKVEPDRNEFKVVEPAKKDTESLDDELKNAGIIDDSEDDLSAEEDEKEREEFLAGVKKTFALAPQTIDISDFTETAPVSATSVLSSLTTKDAQAASDWALWSSKMPITLRKFSGLDLKNMSDAAGGRRNSVNTLYERMRYIYDHDMNPNKPDTLEGWAKSIASTDINDIWFTVYDAAFHNSNHIPCVCEHCEHSFISEHIPTINMVKFPDEEFKQEFMALRDSAPRKAKRYNPKAKLIPITDSLAVAVKPADMYDYGFIIRLVGEDFYKKYRETVDILPNIEDFYHIDLVKKTKQRISVAPRDDFQGDSIKEIKNRIIIYNRIIKSLDSDQYSLLVGYAATESTPEDEKRLSYEIPEIICPKCGKPLAARPLDESYGLEQLVFERRPLALITIS